MQMVSESLDLISFVTPPCGRIPGVICILLRWISNLLSFLDVGFTSHMIYSNKSEMLLDVEYLDGTDESLQESKE